jgi:hypothetical protein
MSQPQTIQADNELQRLKQQIAEVVAQREAIKSAVESGNLSAGEGLRRLAPLDERLSALDSAFKQGWDAQQ